MVLVPVVGSDLQKIVVGLVRRLERLLLRDRVTHLLAGMGLLAGLTEAVAARGRHPFRTHITIQGDDLFLHYARDAAARARATARLAELVRGAEIPAVAVSRAYAQEMEELLGLPRGQLGVLHPGLELAPEAAPAAARATVAALLPGFDPARPLVTFLGRTDSEKGVDLLLYALRILQARGLRPRIAIAGIPSFGADYEQACRRMARQMELPAEFIGPVSEPQRDALFVCSRCVVYPAIHTESFGMVAAEALAQGTPAVVPRRGGLVEAVSDGESAGGLLFEPWDSADLARQIETLLTDAALHARLAAAAPGLARRFDIEAIADRLLGQLGLPRRSDAASP